MQDEDRQTQEAFDSITGEAMSLTPPRVEDQALSPRSEAGRGLDPVEFARPSFESALERFRSAGDIDVDPEDPALFNAYRRSVDYLGDMALGGLDLSDAAFRAAVGIVSQALPENQERSFARDLAAMPEAFMGYSPGRIQAATDRVAEGVAQVGRNLNQPGPMPVLGSNLGNLASGSPSPRRGPANVPRFTVRGENTSLPSPTFGNMRLRDLYEEDQWESQLDLDFTAEEDAVIGFYDSINPDRPLFVNPDNGDTFGTGPTFTLGYAPNLRVHDLADIVLGRRTAEEALDYIGMDPEPEVLDYVNKRISSLQENPEFQEYVERYRGLNEPYDPTEFISSRSLQGREGSTVATFRSPIPDVLNQIEFPNAGIKGSQLLKALQDNPSIRGSELRSLGVNIDPQKRYSEEEARRLFEGRLWTATASLQSSPMYGGYQRQKVLDPVIDYFELTVNANRSDAPNFRSLKSQHFDENTLSHTRASVREDSRGEYILPEEFQSDLLQQGFVPATPNIKQTLSDRLSSDLNYYPDIDWDDYIVESNFTETLGNYLNGVGRATDFEGGDSEFHFIWNALEDVLDPATYNAFKYDAAQAAGEGLPLPNLREYFVPKNYAEPPIQKTVEGVRLAFDGLLAEAQRRGINRIVIPPFERIVAERFTPGSAAYFRALQPSSGFYATYRKGLDQVLREYENEFGRQNFNTRLVDMDYEPVAYVEKINDSNRRVVELPNTGIEVNFQGALDAGYDFSSPRFAEGGLVQNYNSGGVVSMEEQMSLFEMGGLADDGAMRDPVSGNEVPPGSLATEVRDDVPAMLSEGEYIVPADVVRYYGVRFFEDLRSQAKAGLMDMERNGRIGGEPVPGPEGELSPEEMAMLAEITGMYAGGDVRKPQKDSMSVEEVLAGNFSLYDIINSPVRIRTPEGADATSPEMKRELFRAMGLIQIADASGMYGGGMVRKGYQTGGTVTQQDFMNQAQQAENYRLPSSVFAPSAPTTQPTAPFTPVTLYGPTGDTMLATTQEQYNSLIAQGYTTQPRVTQPVAPTGGGGDGGGGFDDLEAAGGGFRLSDENFESLRNNPLAFGTEALSAELPLGASTRQVAGALSMVAGPVGMIAGGLGGAAFELDNIAKARAALKVAESQGLAGTAEYTALETRLRTAEENLTGPARLLEKLGLGSGNSYINQYEEFTSTTPAAPAAGRTSTGGGAPTTLTPAPARDSVTFVSEGPARGTVAGPGQAARPGGNRPAPEPRDSTNAGAGRGGDPRDFGFDRTEASKTSSQKEAERAAERLGTEVATKGRATGGLVAKPSRKKSVAKKK